MATDAKKHVSPAPGEVPTRAALAAMIFSAADIIPVANATEANQVADSIEAKGQVLASNPVFVSRADARGLHRIEYTYDGTVWLPASGVLQFASVAAATTWAAANSAYLTVGDVCKIGAFEYTWTGTAWVGGPATLTPSAGITLSYRLHRIGQLVVLDLSASKATDMVANELLTTIPAEYRPVNQVNGGLHMAGGFGFIGSWGSVMTTGEVRANSPGASGVRNAFFNLTWVRDS